MSQFFFIVILLLSFFLRPIISVLAVVLKPLVPFIKKRLDFERLNFTHESSLPFKHADFCFEISSEGELEQVRPLLEAALKKGKNVELLYSSPSVESKCQRLYLCYPENLRLLRLPLLSASFLDFLYFRSVWQWVKSPVVIFCRYDFFPELLILKFLRKKFVLVSGAFKKTSWAKKESFKFFDVVVAATIHEKERFSDLLRDKAKIYSCDFRVPRISERHHHASDVLIKKTLLLPYLEKIKNLPDHQKVILGSVWPSDLSILKNAELIKLVQDKKLNLLLAPHKIDDSFCLLLKNLCSEIFGPGMVELINEGNPHHKEAPVVILQTGGILCELYSLFKISYVGGGYERSIHSVLEPFFSNNIVITGPATHRSTEFDLILELIPSEIHVLNNPDSFYNVLKDIDVDHIDISARENFKALCEKEMGLIIKEIVG